MIVRNRIAVSAGTLDTSRHLRPHTARSCDRDPSWFFSIIIWQHSKEITAMPQIKMRRQVQVESDARNISARHECYIESRLISSPTYNGLIVRGPCTSARRQRYIYDELKKRLIILFATQCDCSANCESQFARIPDSNCQKCSKRSTIRNVALHFSAS